VKSWYKRKKGESHTLQKKGHLIKKSHKAGGYREHFSVFCIEDDCIQMPSHGNLGNSTQKLYSTDTNSTHPLDNSWRTNMCMTFEK